MNFDFVRFAYVAGPGVAQDGRYINWGVCDDGVVVELLLGIISVFKLKWKM